MGFTTSGRVTFSGKFNFTSPTTSLDDIPGLVAWWDSIDSSSFTFGTGTNVATWVDKKNNIQLAESIDGRRPNRVSSSRFSGKDSVRYTMTNNDRLATSLTSLLSLTSCTVFFVCASNAASQTGDTLENLPLLYFENGGTDVYLNGRTTSLSGESVAIVRGTARAGSNVSWAIDEPLAISYGLNTTISGSSIWKNDTDVSFVGTTGSGSLSPSFASTISMRLEIFNGFHSGTEVDVSSIIIYDRILSNSERSSVYDYIQNRYF